MHRPAAVILALIALLAAVSGVARMAHESVSHADEAPAAHHAGEHEHAHAVGAARACEPAPVTAAQGHVCGALCLFFGHAGTDAPVPLVPTDHPDCSTCELLTTLATFGVVLLLAAVLGRSIPPRFRRPASLAAPSSIALLSRCARGPPRPA